MFPRYVLGAEVPLGVLTSIAKPFTLEAHAADIDLEFTSRTKREVAHIGVGWQEGLGKYKLTKIVNLAPRFLLKNDFSEALFVKEYKTTPMNGLMVGIGQTAPLYHFTYNTRKLFTFSRSGAIPSWY